MNAILALLFMAEYYVMPFDLEDDKRKTVIFNVTKREEDCECGSASDYDDYVSTYYCVVREDDGSVVFCDDHRHEGKLHLMQSACKTNYEAVADVCRSEHLDSFRGNFKEKRKKNGDRVSTYDFKFYEINSTYY